MRLISTLAVTTALVGVAALAATTLPLTGSYSPTQNYLLAPLASLANLANMTAATATAAAPAGPLDRVFSAKRVHIDKVVAQLELVVSPPGQMHVQAWGKPDTMKQLQVRVVGDELYVRLDKHEEEAWFPWNIFNMWSQERSPTDLRLRITAPTATPYHIEDMTGSIMAGDLDAPLSLEAHSVTARFGRLQSANVSVAGSGKVIIGPIKEQLDIEIAGSGHVEAASASAAHVEIAGGGEVVLGAIAQGLDIEIAGAGDVKAASINGPLDTQIAGSGDVAIGGGTATSFSVEIAGSGEIVFRGHAVNPKVHIMGSGSVTLGSYSGELEKDIAGSGDVIVRSQAPGVPPPPAPPAH